MKFLRYLSALALILIGFGCCGTPKRAPCRTINTTQQARYCHSGRIKVAIDPLFESHYTQLIVNALPTLRELGVDPVVVDWNDPSAQVKVTYWQNALFNIPLSRCLDGRLGIHTLGTNYVLIDPVCTLSENQFQIVVVHEIGHWLGMRHVCSTDGKTTDSCSAIGRGTAIMNPYLSLNHELHFTDLDRQEYNRACPNR